MPKERKLRNFPKKILKRKPVWLAKIIIFGNGNGFKGLEHEIPFRAYNGGEAKKKALPKIQRFLDISMLMEKVEGSPRVEVLLEKMPQKGNGNGGVPSYVLREHSSYFQKIISSKRPSQIFKTVLRKKE